jgi:hypothetical protein
MARLDYNQNLLRDQRETARYEVTHKGQASWGVGPDACGDCSFFVDKKRGSGLCERYRQLMRGVAGPRLPSTARSCRLLSFRNDNVSWTYHRLAMAAPESERRKARDYARLDLSGTAPRRTAGLATDFLKY